MRPSTPGHFKQRARALSISVMLLTAHTGATSDTPVENDAGVDAGGSGATDEEAEPYAPMVCLSPGHPSYEGDIEAFRDHLRSINERE